MSFPFAKPALIAFALLGLVACNPPSSKDASSAPTQKLAQEEGAGSKNMLSSGVEEGKSDINSRLASIFPPNAKFTVGPSVVPGIKEVIVDGNIYYVDEAGQYLFSGEILEISSKANITLKARDRLRLAVIKELKPSDGITFGSKNAKHHLTVFTDVECGYCRKFHEQIDAYTKQGISVTYYPWPRSGLSGPVHEEMVSVWCAKDRARALTSAKSGKPVPPASCEKGNQVVGDYFAIGHRLGVQGTPAVFLDGGQQIGGYVEPSQILKAIEAAQAASK